MCIAVKVDIALENKRGSDKTLPDDKMSFFDRQSCMTHPVYT